MKPWMWVVAIGGIAAYFLWSKRSDLVQLPQRPEPEVDPLAIQDVAGYDDPGARLAEQLWGYSIIPNGKDVRYKGNH